MHSSAQLFAPLPCPVHHADARTPAGRERHRVARHILRAELEARSADTSSLSSLQRLVRRLLLGELARYRREERFPQNGGRSEQMPTFVDAHGTRCAMAHLLEIGGEGALVARIAEERNHAWVRELADEPRLLAWLAAAGLAVSEAAAIQPSYCDTNSSCVCGGGDFSYVDYPVPASGVLAGVVTGDDASGRAIVRVDEIHGDGAGYQVGDTFVVSVYGADPGQSVLAPVGPESMTGGADGGIATLRGVLVDEGGTYQCRSQSVARPISAELFIEAVQSSDCAGTLAAADPGWAENSCSGGGCAASGAGDGAPTTIGILLAIVTALAMRGRKRES